MALGVAPRLMMVEKRLSLLGGDCGDIALAAHNSASGDVLRSFPYVIRPTGDDAPGKERRSVTMVSKRSPAPWSFARVRNVVLALAEFGFSAVLLAIIFSRTDFSEIEARLKQLSLTTILIVVGLLVIQALLTAVRWQAVLSHLGTRASFGRVLSGVLIERFVNQALPSFLAGDGARVVDMTRAGHPLRLVTYSVVIDRVLGLAGLFALVWIVLPLAPWVITSRTVLATLIVVSLVPLLGLAMLVFVPGVRWEAMRRMPFLYYPSDLALQLRGFVIAPRILAAMGIVSVLLQSIPIFGLWILARDLHIPLGMLDATVLVPAIMLATVVPISIAGWGIRESAAVVLLGQVGIGASDAVLLSVLFGLISLLTWCLGGLIWLAGHPRRGRQAPGAGT